MLTDEFDYPLPAARIAQHPLAPRDASRLLVDRGPRHRPDDRHVRDLPELLAVGDVLVVNRTRVLPARLHLRKPTGGAVEVFLLEQAGDGDEWIALVRPGRRVPPGTTLDEPSGRLQVGVGDDMGDGRRLVRLRPQRGRALLDVLTEIGEVPLPPYITAALDDPERYQTVYAASDPESARSVAAPTAGLHLTDDLLARVRARGVDVHTIDLAVGLGTFRPITAGKVEDHTMHGEHYEVSDETWAAVTSGRPVVAVGTTTVRALESAAVTGERRGRTELFIHRGFEFRVVDRLLTNFHQPRSSLLVLVDAFVGPRWRDLYEHALAGDYRFLSFGDAMLLSRAALTGRRSPS